MLSALKSYWITPEVPSDIKLIGSLSDNPAQWGNAYYFSNAELFSTYSRLNYVTNYLISNETIYVQLNNTYINSLLRLNFVDVIDIEKLNVMGLQQLYVRNTLLKNFDPISTTTSSIVTAGFENNFLTTFAPTKADFSSLSNLDLRNNKINKEGYAAMIPFANSLSIKSGTFRFTGNLDSISGTYLEDILISKGRTVIE